MEEGGVTCPALDWVSATETMESSGRMSIIASTWNLTYPLTSFYLLSDGSAESYDILLFALNLLWFILS